MTPAFHCPSRIISGRPYQEAVRDVLGGRPWALVTSPGWRSRNAVASLDECCGPPQAVVAEAPVNPKVSDILELAERLPDVPVVVGLGGGSAMDTAKGLVAVRALKGDAEALMGHLREGRDLPDDFAPAALVAVPTTSGTGSDITRWATIWGDEGVKYSLSHPALYPSHSILDPELCRSMPAEVTLASGLDALSHAMESVWNRHHNPVSDHLAEVAIGLLFEHLGAVLKAPDDIALRRKVQTASLFAALAMGTTQTALAHSISYPFTALFGMPHGFACSFTLAEVARHNMAADADRLTPIARALGCALEELPQTIEDWLRALGLGTHLERYVSPAATDELGDSLITRARAANNLRETDGTVARAIARRSLEVLCGVRRPARPQAAARARLARPPDGA